MRGKFIIILLLISNGLLAQSKLREFTYKVEESFVHDITGYTQGLFFHDGVMYESTGQYGESSFRKVDFKTGKILNYTDYDKKYFIEGSCVLDGRLYVLTWMENICFVYDIKTMNKIGEFRNPREGWGLTTDGKSLIMSDGTSTVYYLDPFTFMEQRKITIRIGDNSINYINELEYINGEIWANVYSTDYILIIDPKTGDVTGRINFKNLLPNSLRKSNIDVFNGIAWDSKTGNIYVTGKLWPRLYRVSLVEKIAKKK